MRNCVVTIVGQKGAGKSQLSRRLVAHTPRLITLDRMMEYGEGKDFVTSQPEIAIDYLAYNWRANFHLVTRFRSDQATALFLRYVAVTAERCPTLPISLRVEEADFYARPQGIEPALGHLYNYGRHARINLVAIARGDTDLHRSIIGNSDFLIACRMHRFSTEMREKFTPEQLAAIRGLKTITPDVAKPVKGTHFLVYPDSAESPADVFASWNDHQIVASPQRGLDKPTPTR